MASATTDSYELDDRFVATKGTVFLSGTQALARLAFDQLRTDRAAGHRTAALVTGYPGSPLGGFDSAVASVSALHPDLPVSCRPALNEEYAATALLGSQLANSQPDARYDGVLGVWYGKAPGVDRATDALRHAVYAGTTPLGGVVALIGDDPVAKSSTVPSSSVGILQDLHIPVLYPSDPAAALELGRHAIALSRYSGLWSALKIVSDVADGTAAVDLDRLGATPILPSEPDPARRADGRLLTPHTLDIEREIYEVRYELARHYASVNRLNAIAVQSPSAWIGLIASGITYGEVRAGLAQLGLRGDDEVAAAGIRVLNMRMPLPFDASIVRDFANGLDEILVIEEKQPHLEQLVMSALYGSIHRPLITGKHDDNGRLLVPGHGGLDADGIVPVLRRRLAARLADRLVPERPTRDLIPVTEATRTPYYCSGCPHNRSTETPEGSLVGAGIGCHTMVLMMEPERVGHVMALTPMGNEGTQWIGMSDFVETDHFIQNLGDGTYFHSGQLAITAAIAAGVNITYKLLYNGAVAMTGGQHPQGQRSVADVVEVLRHQGVAEIIVTTDAPGELRDLRGSFLHRAQRVKVWDRTRVVEAQEHLATVAGVTVLIHVQPCAAELRRTRKRGLTPTPSQRVTINQRVCEGCGDCGRVSNCLSVQPIDTPFGRKTAIDQSTCNLDFSCLDGDCPSFITVDTDPPRWRHALERVLRRPTAETAELAAAADRPASIDDVLDTPLPAPEIQVSTDDFAVRIAGIGGTGVVTVAQIIGTAAMLDGFRVRGLDQVGLSQKAGPVVSDLRLSIEQPASNRVGVGEADLLLLLDQLVGSLPKTLATAGERTIVVGSNTVTPTGRDIRHPDLPVPTSDALAAEIAAASASTEQHWADFTAVANDAFGSSTTANIIGVGMAVQLGALPLPPERIEEAITLNGTAVSLNLRGFLLGRQLAHRPHEVHMALAATPTDTRSVSPLPIELADRIAELDARIRPSVERYAIDLIAYQDLGLAERYVATVARVADVEQTIDPGASKLTTAVAENLHRVMAYKDEYEVARLILDPAGRADAEQIAGTHGVIKYRLHPPLLRDHGLDRKIALGTWADPMFRALARGKRLRGTRIDPFGRTTVRRAERRFVGEYVQVIEMIVDHLSPESYDAAVEIAALPESVRGYESLKLERLAEFGAKLNDLVPRLIDENHSPSTIVR